MSHIPQRKEKDCLNCGTIVQGKYCQDCGQENVVPHESFGHMVKHFVYDITHFDSKFFDSMKYLLFKPGFLPMEYIKGKRASYLNPVKKYVFTSAIFFLLFFSFFAKTGSKIGGNLDDPISKKERIKRIADAERELEKNSDNPKLDTFLIMLKDTSRVVTNNDLITYWDDFEVINISGRKYKSRNEYDSVQKKLPVEDRDGWFVRLVQLKNIKIKEKYGNAPGKVSETLIGSFLKSLPYMLFVSLPFFALILKILYLRRKQYFYADHGIFTIYHYIFTFFLLALVFASNKLAEVKGFAFMDAVTITLFLSGGVYLYLSMKRFYQQRHGKTLVKFILLNIAAFIIMIILFLAFLLLSVFQI